MLSSLSRLKTSYPSFQNLKYSYWYEWYEYPEKGAAEALVLIRKRQPHSLRPSQSRL